MMGSVSAEKPKVGVWLEKDLLPNGLVTEMALGAIGRDTLHAAGILRALANGLLEKQLSVEAEFDYTTLPWSGSVLAELRNLREQGATLVLFSHCSEDLARQASAHLELFDEYVGGGASASTDASLIWIKRSDSPSLVNNLKAAIAAVRPHQWVKNVLVFVPLAVSGHTSDLNSWIAAILAFFAFSFAASSIYLLNDLTDLDADRAHPRKRNRPFASGKLPVSWGFWMIPLLAGLGLVAGYAAGGVLYVVLYALLSISYSIDLKKRSMYDVFALAALYTVRLFGGGEMSGYSPSVWLLAFSVFLFLGLALMKRVAELVATENNKLKRRGYRQVDRPLLMSAGVACSFCASLVLALYLDSDEVRLIYTDPVRLWLTVPLMLFWQLKLWHKTLRGRMTDDPIVFAAKDRVSWIIGVLIVASALLAGYPA